MQKIALSALCAALICSSAHAQSLLGVAPTTQTSSVSRVTPTPPYLPPQVATGTANSVPRVSPGQPDAVVQYANTFYDSGLLRLQEELLAAFVKHEAGPQHFPANEANLRALTIARTRWKARRTAASLVYRDMTAAVEAFTANYRRAWELSLHTPVQKAAKFRYEEAHTDLWKLARDPMAPFNAADAQRYHNFWAMVVANPPASNVEREIARVLLEVYKAQLAVPRGARASR